MLATWGCTTFPKPTLSLDFLGATSLDSGITFSRGSQATLFDSTGTLVYAKHNLLLQSEDFATTWSATAVTISTNATNSPSGTLTADKIIETAATSDHRVNQGSATLTAGQNTISIYAKAAERFVVRTQFDGTIGGLASSVVVDVNLLTGIAATPVAVNNLSAASASVFDNGNGWYRIVLTFTSSASGSGTVRFFLLQSVGGATSYAGDGTSGLFLWGAQLNLANMEGGVTSSLTTYYPTTTAAYYAPRFDYNPSTLQPRGLLIEEQRTNSIRNNTMQGAVAGTPGTAPTNWSASVGGSGITRTIVGTGTENGITYIDFQFSGTGSGSAFQVINTETTTGIAAATGQTWSGSFYLKLVAGSTTGTNITMQLLELASGSGVIQNLSAALSPTTQGLATQRTTYSATLSGGATVTNLQQGLRLLFTNGVAVDITLRIGLPQLEQGAFATSVIPTTTTALTRNADVASMTGTNFSSWYSAGEGTLLVQASKAPIPVTANSTLVDISDGTTNNRMRFWVWTGASSGLLYTVRTSGADQGNMVSGTLTSNVLFKAAFVYKVNDFAAVLNGAAPVTDTNGTVPTVNALQIGATAASGENIGGYIQRIAYYPVRLQASQLQALTA